MERNVTNAFKKSLALAFSAIIAASAFSVGLSVSSETVTKENAGEAVAKSDSSYFSQYSELKNLERPLALIELSAQDSKNPSALKTDDGVEYLALNQSNHYVEWTFTVEKSGVYSIENFYRGTADFERDITVSVTVDGKLPFEEAEQLTLPRKYSCEYEEGDYPYKKNLQGDDIRPDQVQVFDWIHAFFYNPVGFYEEPYLFRLEAGNHTIRYELVETAVDISKIVICNKSYITYKEYLEEYGDKAVSGNASLVQQAEHYESVNNKNIYANTDKSDPATLPNNPKNALLNTVGGSGWSLQGTEISWEVPVKEAGLYRVIVRGRQNLSSGLNSYRTLKINGEIPFEEAKAISFPYSQGWKIYTLGTEEGLLLHLEPGDIITLSSTTGEMADVLRSLQSITDDLTALYRQVIGITSVNPDPYQDYKLEDKLPELEDNLKAAYKQMTDTYDRICEIIGAKGSLASSLKYSADNVESFAEKPYEIPERLSTFSSTVESLGSLIASLEQQPLELDYIAYLDDKAELPKSGAGFFKLLSFGIKQFIYSFTSDYDVLTNEADVEKTIKVWVSTGRDQAQILSELINSDFMPNYKVGVKLSLVDTSTTLLKATLAGKGPDVALMVAQGYPVELAARGAIVDLTSYITEEDKNQYHESALVPFYYNGGLYALPETQSFPVIFYRTDIFEQFGISVPNTWEEFYEVMEVIQSKNLVLGLPEIDSTNYAVSSSLNIFEALLVQNDGMYYVDDLSKTQFDTETAYQAFTDWSNLYTDYSIDRELNFYNRFRTGEVPMAIRNIGEYLQIKVAAPEINGKWDIAPIPGTVLEDGNIDRSISSIVTGCIVLKASEKRGVKDEAVEFIKWWTGNTPQEQYGRNLEVTLGTAGRYFTANLKAFEKIDWSTKEFEVLNTQRSFSVNQPSIPGSYAVSRDLTSALREVIEGTNRPRRALMLYNSDINEEIARKRKEFGLGE